MTSFFLLTLIFVFGLAVGSFLNCLIYRLEKNKNFISGKSQCPNCGHQLAWHDLIPLVSFFILKGNCRYCHQKISLQYPLVELFTGIIFILVFYYFLNLPFANWQLVITTIVFYWLISCFLILVFVYDFRYSIIPDKISYPAILITFAYQGFRVWNFGHWDLFACPEANLSCFGGIWNFLIAAIIGSGFFFLLYTLSHGKAIGFGDVKLGFLIGLILGWPKILVGLWISFLIGGLIAILLVVLKKKTLKSKIPLGPFLVFGTFAAIFWADQIINLFFCLK